MAVTTVHWVTQYSADMSVYLVRYTFIVQSTTMLMDYWCMYIDLTEEMWCVCSIFPFLFSAHHDPNMDIVYGFSS